jgi:Flp pilus assembly protein TadG
MFDAAPSDRRAGTSVTRHDLKGVPRPLRHGESGQAMVEFALILFPLLILVVGVIQFGIGLNYWLDENRIANQGARFAVVNAWPGCERTDAADSCTNTPACGTAVTPAMNQSLVNYLRCQAITQGLRSSATVTVCYPDDGDPATQVGQVGTPVRVRVETPFTFVPILNIGTITLRGNATMRLEQDETNTFPLLAPRHLTGVGPCP